MRLTVRTVCCCGGAVMQSNAAFERHVEQLAVYGGTLCVNLVDKKPGMQKRLGEAFDKVVRRYNEPGTIECVLVALLACAPVRESVCVPCSRYALCCARLRAQCRVVRFPSRVPQDAVAQPVQAGRPCARQVR